MGNNNPDAIADPARLAALHKLALLDTPYEPAFDRLTRLAATLMHCPVALMTLIDAERLFIKSQHGLAEPERSSPLDCSYCQYVVSAQAVFMVEDSTQHPIVAMYDGTVQSGIRSYLGVPLTLSDGHIIGAFSVYDFQPRKWLPGDVSILQDLAALIITELELREEVRQRTRSQHAFEALLVEQSEQRALLDSILNSMADGVVVADMDARIVIYNHAARDLLGLGLFGESGTEWWNHYPSYYPDKQTPYDTPDLPLARAIRGESLDEVEIYVEHPNYKDGLYTSRSARPIYDPEGNITGGVVVIHNISRRKQAEETVRRLNEELAAANADLEAFGHTIAHDLKAPVHIIGGYTALLDEHRELLPDEGKWMLDVIDRTVTRMTGMINSLLLFAQLRSVEEKLGPVEMRPVIDAVIERLELPLQERGVKVITSDDLPGVHGYAPWLEEVFANLISNAIKYMSKNNTEPRVTIRAQVNGGMIRYEISDNGMGISTENQAKLFKMFERFHEGHAEGTGLGLSIVARIIAKLGGEIGVESAAGQGSTFWFALPSA